LRIFHPITKIWISKEDICMFSSSIQSWKTNNKSLIFVFIPKWWDKEREKYSPGESSTVCQLVWRKTSGKFAINTFTHLHQKKKFYFSGYFLNKKIQLRFLEHFQGKSFEFFRYKIIYMEMLNVSSISILLFESHLITYHI